MARPRKNAAPALGAAPQVFDEEAGTVKVLSDVPAESESADGEAVAEFAAPVRYRVSLSCPTPLAHQTLTVEARSDAEARAAFNAANGISGSDHTYTVTRV